MKAVGIMKKLKLKFVIVGAMVLYIIAFVLFHVNYDYGKYMREEWEILVPATLIYLIAVALLVFGIHNKRGGFEKELSEVSVDNLVKSIDETETNIAASSGKENSEFVGTGVIGLIRYVTFCKIVGIIGLYIGVVFFLAGVIEKGSTLVYGLYMIICSVGCLLSTLFVNALVTITKAAKIYIDNNKNK